MLTDSLNNTVYFSALLPEVAPKTYQGLVETLNRYDVPFHLLEGTKDIWCRDYMPLQIFGDTFSLFGYNPDYLRESRWYRATISENLSVSRTVQCIRHLTDNRGILVDGGNVVYYGSKVVMTAKVFEENPSIPVRDLVKHLEDTLGARIIFVPWDTDEIYGHSDGILRIIDQDTVLMTNYAQIDPIMAKRFRNCLSPHFERVIELKYDVKKLHRYSWAYINWLQTDKVLIVPGFNTPEDVQALEQIGNALPEYRGRIEMVDATDLVSHGGGLNCASWTIKE